MAASLIRELIKLEPAAPFIEVANVAPNGDHKDLHIAFMSRREQFLKRSLPGVAIAVASLIAMPLLSRAKRRVGVALDSAAMAADARQTDFCTYLSAILLGGLLLNALFGLWWADPVAGFVMVPIIAKEGIWVAGQILLRQLPLIKLALTG